jgi:ATP-binding cassette, subfamily F, member 3
MISAENISKGYGRQALFDEASFQINRRERVGLVGRNGHGKTTLFRLLAGLEQPDSGSMSIPRGYRIGYVQQHLNFTLPSVLDEAAAGLPHGHEHETWKAEKILAGLGFTPEQMQRSPHEFSGGFQVRLNLASVLVSEPDLLLLDEPTNYLDIVSIRWIEGFLQSWPHELLLITHDRSFMDRVVTHTMGIHRNRIRKYPGTTEKYYAQIAQDEEIHEKTRVNDERKRKEMELFITRFRAKARLAGLVQSRVKALEKQEKRDKLETVKTLEFSFRSSPFNAKFCGSASGVSFSYDTDSPLINNFNLTIARGDRVCVVGPNGRGKTTLLKLLAGSLQPQKGDVTWHQNVRMGFFEQTNIASLVGTRTVEQEIMSADTQVDHQLARDICGAMMFEGDFALKKISVISGGEKSRVMLGKILAAPVNLLVLDEPTNHLDMQSCDALIAALDNFDGAVVMVTHNELFLHALAERLVVFQNNRINVFEGRYQEFLDRIGWQDEERARAAGSAPHAAVPEQKFSKKELRKLRSDIISERSRVLGPLEKKIAAAEAAIEACEAELARASAQMQSASESGEALRIVELSKVISRCDADIDRLFDELSHDTAQADDYKKLFDERLARLEIADR